MSYKTVHGSSQAELIEKKSRFIGYIKGVSTEEEAAMFISSIKSRHYDATHNVYAYVLRQNNIRRYSDDGEPQGTAGVPVLDVLLKEEIMDAAVVVTRYFGGTLLGAGGLVRAYSKSAKMAVDAIGIVTMKPCAELKVRVPYPLLSGVQSTVSGLEGSVAGADYGEEVELICIIPVHNVSKFEAVLSDISSGKIMPEKIGENFYP